jgi:O-methyltransferase involved in polyketide biosynthesis
MHVQIDSPPHIIEDEIGFKLVAPGDGWQQRPDMNPDLTKRLRASMVARARFILYLTKDAILATLRQIATLAPGSKLAMSFYLPLDLLDEEDKPLQEIAEKGARSAGTPFISFFTPNDILALAREAGFENIETISTSDLVKRYFVGRTDNFCPSSGEKFLVATT